MADFFTSKEVDQKLDESHKLFASPQGVDGVKYEYYTVQWNPPRKKISFIDMRPDQPEDFFYTSSWTEYEDGTPASPDKSSGGEIRFVIDEKQREAISKQDPATKFVTTYDRGPHYRGADGKVHDGIIHLRIGAVDSKRTDK